MATRPELDDLARRLEPRLARRLEELMDSIKDSATLDQLERFIRNQDINGLLGALGVTQQSAAVVGVQNELRNIVQSGAGVISTQVPRLAIGFDILNPSTVSVIQDYEFNLIREITQNTRNGIRETVVDSLRTGTNPRVAARTVKESVGLTQKQQVQVANFRRDLESFHLKRSARRWNLGGKISRSGGGSQVFATDANGNPLDGIFERRLRDFRHDRALQSAMNSGRPLTKSQIDKMVAGYRRKSIKNRAENIARTESLRAAHLGVQEQWEQSIQQGIVQADEVKRFWRVALDERLCKICRPIPSLNSSGVGLRQSFNTPVGPTMLPPVHPRCRCTVVFDID